ncbi:MAG TPA: polymer-forming cytoskeletal protein [Burkholderiaceae bacterium]|nr:polymer-forming cytoskeletal protein [Burkholderiaceae bacterium]
MAVWFAAFALALLAQRAPAQDDHAHVRLGGAVFVAGGMLSVREPVAGDLFAAGGHVEVDGAIGGDAMAAGGRLRVAGDVGQALRAAGGEVIVQGRVGHSARVAGGHIEFGPKSEVLGDLSVGAGQIRLLGSVHGDVQAAGGRLRIDGPVGGDVLATTGQVELGPNARIAGKLRYRGGPGIQRDPAAQVAGGVETWGFEWGHDNQPVPRHAHRGATAGWIWTAGLVVLAAVLLAALPGFQARVGQTLQQRPGLSVLLGFVWLVCAPVALVLLVLTVIGVPLALLGVALYLALLPVAYVSAAIALGDWGLRALHAAAAAHWAWRAAAAALVLALLWQAMRVPWLGVVLGALAVLGGLGALALQLRRRPAAG